MGRWGSLERSLCVSFVISQSLPYEFLKVKQIEIFNKKFGNYKKSLVIVVFTCLVRSDSMSARKDDLIAKTIVQNVIGSVILIKCLKWKNN